MPTPITLKQRIGFAQDKLADAKAYDKSTYGHGGEKGTMTKKAKQGLQTAVKNAYGEAKPKSSGMSQANTKPQMNTKSAGVFTKMQKISK